MIKSIKHINGLNPDRQSMLPVPLVLFKNRHNLAKQFALTLDNIAWSDIGQPQAGLKGVRHGCLEQPFMKYAGQ